VVLIDWEGEILGSRFNQSIGTADIEISEPSMRTDSEDNVL
jgi:hypothetical protein